MIFTVEELIEGRTKPISVTRDTEIVKALAIMTEYDFSQLPVVNPDDTPAGIITSDSILRAANHLGVTLKSLKVNHAMEEPKTTPFDGDLFELLDEVKTSYAVLVLDPQGHVAGIVTHYDTTLYFRKRTEDMMVIEDIETTLREYIRAIYNSADQDSDELRDAINEVANSARKLRKRYELALRAYLKSAHPHSEIVEPALEDSFKCFRERDQNKSLDDLTLDEYTEVFLRNTKCPSIGDPGDSNAIRQLLSGVRETRNTLAHFRGDIAAAQRDQLRFCSTWLRRALSDELSVQKPGVTKAISETNREPEDAPTEEEPMDSESTYAPISRELQRLPTGLGEIAYSFTQIEAMIGRKLPASAREHRAWWGNDRQHTQARQWLDAGWKVKTVSGDTVVFSKIKEREQEYNDFFTGLVTALKERGICPPEVQLTGRSYFCCAVLRGSAKRQLKVYASFARNGRLRVELYISLGEKDLNKSCWQFLFERRSEIERKLGDSLAYERLDGKSAARVALYQPGMYADGRNQQLVSWAGDAVARMGAALREPVQKALDSLASQKNLPRE